MTATALIRPVSSMMWELRAAWARGRRVVVSLDRPAADWDGVPRRVVPQDEALW